EAELMDVAVLVGDREVPARVLPGAVQPAGVHARHAVLARLAPKGDGRHHSAAEIGARGHRLVDALGAKVGHVRLLAEGSLLHIRAGTQGLVSRASLAPVRAGCASWGLAGAPSAPISTPKGGTMKRHVSITLSLSLLAVLAVPLAGAPAGAPAAPTTTEFGSGPSIVLLHVLGSSRPACL